MISPEQLQHIASSLKTVTLNEAAISQIRADNPGIHFTYCMDDDIPELEPMLAGEGFNLYLIDGREHCLCLTANYENATGIVIAEVIPE
jgi:Family of unknown function (DUF6129)